MRDAIVDFMSNVGSTNVLNEVIGLDHFACFICALQQNMFLVYVMSSVFYSFEVVS